MPTNIPQLPSEPSYDEACDIIDDSPDDYWFPFLDQIRIESQLPEGDWIRIREGGNVLFKLAGRFIIKIVPPNWDEQGSAEIHSSELLAGKLSIPIPEVIANGAINNWIFVVMTLLPGDTLSEVWNELGRGEKITILKQLGCFMRELHQLPAPDKSPIRIDWAEYQQKLIDDCVPRHTRKGVPTPLVNQIANYINSTEGYFDDDQTFFIHMDLHIWNLMVDKVEGKHKISGVLDFGDAVIGKSRLLELNTPILFLCKGDKELIDVLLDSYQLLEQVDANTLRQNLMTVALLRPACDFNFVLQ